MYNNSRCEGAFFDWLPDSPILNDLPAAVKLCAVPDSATDNGTLLRVYGYDAANKWIMENGVDGFLVPVVFGSTVPSSTAPLAARITRVSKAASKGFIKLSTLDVATNTVPDVLLGYYYPDECEPNYRRIRVSRSCATVRIAYRKKTRKINSLTDVINLRSRPAIINAVKAHVMRLSDPNGAEGLMAQAVEMLRDEQARRNQNMPPRPVEMEDTSGFARDWGGYGYYRGY